MMRNFFLFSLFLIGSLGCLTCPVQTFTTTPENFNASVPTSIIVESNYKVKSTTIFLTIAGQFDHQLQE
jgi:hypothetical protein